MHILIAAIGKARAGSHTTQLFDEYKKRLSWTVTLKELEEKKPLPDSRRIEREAQLLTQACEGVDRIIALDERGKDLSSAQLAKQIGDWQMEGFRKLAFIIGGQDGLSPNLRAKAHLTLSLGRLTWPHMLVRPLIAEQLYRAYTILTNHPYHRE
jgi:23S rRNA (pseudouridine1915-N3)-methyltransferase